MTRLLHPFTLLALAVLLVGLSPPARAQGTGTLAGRVTDDTGMGLPGANVIIDGTSLGAATDADGLYRIIGVPVGTYSVTASFTGFRSVQQTGVAINNGYTRTLDFSLAPGDIELGSVEVVYVRPLIQADALGAPRVVSGDDIAALQSGVTTTEGTNDLFIRGGREQEVSYFVNGVRVNLGDLPVAPADREGYAPIEEVGFRMPTAAPLSTFSIDVDAASYANVRRFLTARRLPVPDAVRVEEFVNYFSYRYPEPEGDRPFSVTTDVTVCPWAPAHRLVRVGLQARHIERDHLPPNNLVFLIDVSGSMQSGDKLPLLVRSLRLLVQQLRPEDRVAMVVYAGAAGVVLPPTSGDEQQTILAALDRLEAGGSTAGGEGLRLAYRVAREHFDPQANNRIILATDGDFNVGTSSDAEMRRLVEEECAGGVALSVLGFGEGNLQDAKMELMAQYGNGNYSYIDSIREGQRVLVQEMGGTLLSLAKDVKIQVEFNPATVAGYRLIGYENRALRDEEFADDTRDAGEIGAGQSVTALYEVVPVGTAVPTTDGGDPMPEPEELRYQTRGARANVAADELLTVRLRYKPSTGPGQFADTSVLMEHTVRDAPVSIEAAPEDVRFVVGVTAFALLLRESDYRGEATWALARGLTAGALGQDPGGYRAELVGLIGTAEALADEAAQNAVGETPQVTR